MLDYTLYTTHCIASPAMPDPTLPVTETLRFRPATPADSELLAPLNAQHIRDEGHRNSMTLPQLVERMAAWFRGDYRGVIFESDGGVIG